MTTIAKRGLLAAGVERITEQTDPRPVDNATVALWPLIGWLETDAEEELAAAVLAERPGDTDVTAAREQVREVLDALMDVIYGEYGVPG